ncbi:zf-HC2 domain-containing protein [Edaphobacter sp. HDX4]|uniref:anti-sigma factor family protein n=1 Tax=Edaphobacter sp. HDX4 TaxID=2794064 RepID=UPI002FE5D76D
MAEINQFGNAQPSRSPEPAHCAQCEAMLTDALDRSLAAEDQATFDRHLAICPECSRMFIDARLGADLLRKLHKARPDPPADLLARILASTGPVAGEQTAPLEPHLLQPQLSQAASLPIEGVPVYGGVPYPGKVLPFRKRVVASLRFSAVRHTLMQPRLAMTAAMAFFSIALTLNLTGIRITELRANDFTPSSIKRTFYDTNARVVRSIDNLRVVYELESRVRDLQRDNDTNGPSAPESTAPVSKPAPDDSHRDHQEPKDQQDHPRQSNPRQHSGSSRSLGLDASRILSASLSEPGSPQPGRESHEFFVLISKFPTMSKGDPHELRQSSRA